MKIVSTTIKIDTKKRFEFIDITKQVENFLVRQNAVDGQVLIYSKHTTMAITINEKETGIFKDAELYFKKMFPEKDYYFHNDFDIRTENLVCDGECKNGDSHLQHLIFGSSEIVPVVDSKLVLGLWQKILTVELDGPRFSRQIVIQFIGK